MSRVRLLVVAAALASPALLEAQVRFERTGYRLTSIGERISVSARLATGRRPATIRWRIADPTIASVDARGTVVSRKPGNTKLWAVAGEDSASALILVDQWAAKFDFAPALVRLDAVGAKAPLRIRVQDAGGHPINDAGARRTTSSCRSMNTRVATLSATNEVNAVGNGVTFIRCTDRGIADSVRVEVRQRPTTVSISDKSLHANRVVMDSFALRLVARDRTGGEIREPTASWASLNPGIVLVDPTSGMARAVGLGTAKIVAQTGDVTDTITVGVASAPGQAIPANVDSVAAIVEPTAPKQATFRIEATFPFVGDTTPIRYSARDESGAEVEAADVTIRSTDEGTVQILPGRRMLGRKAGNVFLVGRFRNIIDSTQISVRERGTGTATVIDDEANASFTPPSFDAARFRARYDSGTARIRDSILNFSPVGRAATGRYVAVTAVGGHAMHFFSDSTGSESRSGLLYGGVAEIAPLRKIRLIGEFRTGTLTSAEGAAGNDLTVTEAAGTATLQATNWLGLSGTYMLRAMKEGADASTLALQTWTAIKGTAAVRLTFVGGAIRTLTAISAFPYADYTGYLDESGEKVKPNPFSMAGEVGLDAHVGRFNIGMSYYVEKFSFPAVGTSERVDQFSTIRLRLGLQLGR